MEEQVVLVDENDSSLGSMEKMEAHEKCLLHRAFSIFIFNSKRELLIHQRADSKYHSPGLWTNTCCSHPRPNESLEQATKRRLQEEMGMEADLDHRFHFIYKAELDGGLWEHELDHVFFGESDNKPNINTEEVKDWKYVSMKDLKLQMSESPDHFTIWFQIVFARVVAELGAAT